MMTKIKMSWPKYTKAIDNIAAHFKDEKFDLLFHPKHSEGYFQQLLILIHL